MKVWSLKNIQMVKDEVKETLDCRTGQNSKKRLDAIMQGIRGLETSSDPKGLLYLYVYIMSALVHQSRFGGLSSKQIRKLKELAFTILKVQNINPQTSKLGVLFGELHLAISLVYRSSGEHWAALWEEQISDQLCRKNPVGGVGFQSISKGMRALRVGQGTRAIGFFCTSMKQNLNRQQIELANIGLVRSLRLSGKIGQCEEVIQKFLSDKSIGSAVYHQELVWEHTCLKASKEKSLDEMVELIKPKNSHNRATYMVEAFLWSLAIRERHWVQSVPKIQTISRKEGLQARNLGFFLKAAYELETCNATFIPIVTRLNNLGKILSTTNRFVAIDRELLFLVASVRWLAKNQSFKLAEATLNEYEGLSLKLSDGRTNDVLNLAEDLFERPWYKSFRDVNIIDKVLGKELPELDASG